MNIISSLLNFIGKRFEKIQGGVVNGQIVSAGAYLDIPVTFPKSYDQTPKVTVSLYSTSTGGGTGRVAVAGINITNTGFTIRVFNGDSVSRGPGINWIAIP